MSSRNRPVLILVVAALAVLAGCSSSAHNPVPPPSGGFGNTDFNGTYTFALSGTDFVANSIFTMAGSLVACGCSAGTISSGTVDLNDAALLAPASTIGSNSTYQISQDGRGFAKLMITTTASVAIEVDIDFVLTSNAHGLIIRFDGNGTGSGTIDLQPSSVTLANTNYAFMLSGTNASGTSLSTVGAFTLNSAGAITAGVQDFNVGGTAANVSLTGSVLVGSGTAPGTATLTTSFNPSPLTFDVYGIDATHLKLIETDTQGLLVGDVFTQPTASIPMENLAFTMSNFDSNGNLIAIGGLMSSDGVSKITTGSEDLNDAGSVTTANPFSGTFASTGGGRLLITLTGFLGGTNFAAYPSSGGLLMLDADTGLNPTITSGVALTQAATPTISASQGYGLNLTGEDVVNAVELDEIAEFQTTSGSFTNGLLDENDGGPSNPQNFGGSYTVSSNGSGSATNLSSGLASMMFYVVDSSTVLFISTDANEPALGSFQLQTTPTAAIASPVVQRSLPMLRSIPHSRSASQRDRNRIGITK